jgi:hypothetical protein
MVEAANRIARGLADNLNTPKTFDNFREGHAHAEQ